MPEITFPDKFRPLFDYTGRYLVFYGGRGSGKSHSVAKWLILEAMQRRHRILCCREYQNSISDSVLKLLSDQIEEMGFVDKFIITKADIRCINGSQFMFKGLHANSNEIKSTEGVTICYVEEAQAVCEESWDVLIPTVRAPGSRFVINFNPHRLSDSTYRRFIIEGREDCLTVKVNWYDNPFFPDVLRADMEHDRAHDMAKYAWIWEGDPLVITEAQVFNGKFIVDSFETPKVDRFFFGADFGYARDPSTLIRCFILDNRLYIDHEIYGAGIEIDELPRLYDTMPESRKWSIQADSARPETISFIRRAGFNIEGVKKWPGSVEDGIAYLRSFDKIVIHARCKHTIEEFSLYSYKQDKISGEILPIALDSNNHAIDAIRYAMTPYIKGNSFAFF